MKFRLTDFARELRSDIESVRIVPALSAGLTSGLGLLIAQIAFASYMFSGPLASYASQGVGLVLFGNFAACLVIALMGGFRGTIAGLSPALVVGMAVIISTMEASADALFVSVYAALMLSAVLTGICCLLIGGFHCSRLVRFIPYPVSAGFVAGIGGAVCLAAMSLMGTDLTLWLIPTLLEPSSFWRWSPGVAYGFILYWVMKRWRNPLILPISVVFAVGAYYLALGMLDISSTEARASDLLLTGTATDNLWPALMVGGLPQVEWIAVAQQLPNMLALAVVAFVAIVMNIAGLEVATKQELDWDREFTSGGLASLMAGLGGGTVATIIVPASLRSKLFGADTRLTGMVAASVIGVALFVGDEMLQWVPTPLVGGILVFAGLGMLEEGLIRPCRRLPRSEFAIIVLICITIIVFGLLEGVGIGMLAALVFFAIRVSRDDPVESRFTLRDQQSKKVRALPYRAILREQGGRTHVYSLRGYIFFGSIGSLADELREMLREPIPPECLMFDFTGISGCDYSALYVFSQTIEAADAAGVQVVLSATPAPLRRAFRLNLPTSVYAKVLIEPNADRALECCEEAVLEAWQVRAKQEASSRTTLLERAAGDLEIHLERQIRFEALIDELGEWLGTHEYAAGETIDSADAPGGELKLLIFGRVSACKADGVRLCQYVPGDVIGAMAFDQAGVATIVVEESCRIMTVTMQARAWLEQHRQALAMRLYAYLVDSIVQGKTGPGAQ